jgi:peptidyl-prolyl cis-trans isomerase C
VRSQFGYHVIKQTDRKPASKQSFDEAKPQIVGHLGNERKNGAVQTVLTDLRSKAKVDVKLPPPAPEAAPSVAAPPASAPEAKPQPKRQPVEAVTPPVSAPPVEPKK